MKLAFFGFRHGHVLGLYAAAKEQPRVEIVAAVEEHAETAAGLRSGGTVQLTHDSYAAVLESIPCDAIAVGDYFGRRGEIIQTALRAGKHVIADKPICTRMSEL